ncbi:hypothetical protein Pmar_PMAR021294 [Perkinsus marinus ATCC 50983]|uniref:Uncharacterized protein n=1 Tax=Perkinsus marinus (strain ATCC 50983 / TXsc) TaxID=423536 RepID=C5KY72_PERM5|nr:hypothetical protein Pmar_PMAR021294 [Perkinsus marinus ATCC 50983]EER10571.1 hypothetical protein Pmar_PMAR021294 [Perkinsus marinus ATCC 50983]|eukprot:XP_002778776.1 hypothetical protein Pmar_PMAR021294 [Perkinsus marinus ATCC 50983]
MYLRQDEVDALIKKTAGDDMNECLKLRHLWQTCSATKSTTESSRGDTASIADYHFDKQSSADEATNVRSMGEWLQTCKLYGLSLDNCWRFLLKCLSPSVKSELIDMLEERHLLLEGAIESRLAAAETFLRSAFDVKQQSNELIGDYIGRLREGVMEGKCIGLTITQDEILDKFVKGLKPNYQKASLGECKH